MPPVKATTSSSAKRARKPAAKGSTRSKASAKAKQSRVSAKAQSPLLQAQTATKDTASVVGDYAERAVLIPVGAALIARDRVVSSVNDTISTYSSTSKTQAQLRRFERRGVTARNRLEREVRKARVRVERELRQRRRDIETTVSDFETRRDDLVNRVPDIAVSVPDIATRVPELAKGVQERILSLV